MKDFFTPELLGSLFTLVVVPMLGLITTYLIALLKRKTAELEQKMHNETVSKYISMAENAIETAVISVNQTFVENMKKKGTFDQDAMVESFLMAKDTAAAMIGESARKVLKSAFGDLDLWIESKIEYYVKQHK